MKAEWEAKKEGIQAVQNAKAIIEDTRAQAERLSATPTCSGRQS